MVQYFNCKYSVKVKHGIALEIMIKSMKIFLIENSNAELSMPILGKSL